MLKGVDNNIVEEILKQLSKKYNRKQKVLEIMFIKFQELGYGIENFEDLLNEFYCY